MLKKLYRTKNIEEVLGIIGLLYFILIGIATFFLVKFLVGATIASLKNAPASEANPPRFDFEVLDKLEN